MPTASRMSVSFEIYWNKRRGLYVKIRKSNSSTEHDTNLQTVFTCEKDAL
jgi:hypothetical protein